MVDKLRFQELCFTSPYTQHRTLSLSKLHFHWVHDFPSKKMLLVLFSKSTSRKDLANCWSSESYLRKVQKTDSYSFGSFFTNVGHNLVSRNSALTSLKVLSALKNVWAHPKSFLTLSWESQLDIKSTGNTKTH